MYKKQLDENLLKNLSKNTIVSEIKAKTQESEACIQSMLVENNVSLFTFLKKF